MSPFALLTCPLACGCATDAKSISIPQSLAQYWNSLAVNGEPRYVIILLGHTKPMHDVLYEFHCLFYTVFDQRFVFNPLYKFVDCHKYVFEASFCFLSGPT